MNNQDLCEEKAAAVNSQMCETISGRIADLRAVAPGSIGDQLQFELVDGNAAEGQYAFRCETQDWMKNPAGTLHGGMISTIFDQAMGYIAFCSMPGEGIAPTIELQVHYHRPMAPGQTVLVRVFVTSVSKSMIHLRSEAYMNDAPERLCASSNAIYFYKPAVKSR